MSGVCSTHGVDQECYKTLIYNPEREKVVGRSYHLWENNTKFNVKEIRMKWGRLSRDNAV
jgi:hypothetical protein